MSWTCRVLRSNQLAVLLIGVGYLKLTLLRAGALRSVLRGLVGISIEPRPGYMVNLLEAIVAL